MSNKKNLKSLCVCSVLAALFIPLEWLASNFGKIAFLDNYQIPISCFPLILASVMYGIGWGTATAFVGAFLSQIIMFGLGWSSLLWMAPTVIYAFLVALLYKVFRKSDKFYFIAIQFFISSLVLSGLNIITLYIDSLIVGYPYDFLEKFFKIIASLKIVGGLIFAVIFAIIVPPVINKIKKVLKF